MIAGGIGTATMGWTVVQDEVAKFARICVYDRAGYFASDTIPGPRTSEQMARELHTLLVNAGEHGPFVLVGHSFGAFTARVYHQSYPNEVAGVVMVDGSQEDGTATLKSLLPAHRVKTLEAEQRLLLGSEPIAARLGLLRFITEPSGTPSDWKLFPPGMKEQARRGCGGLRSMMWRPRSLRASMSPPSSAALWYAGRPAAGGGDGAATLAWASGDEGGYSRSAGVQQVWVNDLQMRLVHLSTRGTQVIAEKSNHGIQFLEPEVVASAIRDVVQQGGPARAWSEREGGEAMKRFAAVIVLVLATTQAYAKNWRSGCYPGKV